ncbi:MAG TPA: histidine phosphatase family protein, partial [Gaiellaceae bacterium]|nr:histidine phosphatase family protein [Gaiellaceae bacterium]
HVGEPAAEHAERVLAAVRGIAERHPGARILVVTHGGSLRRVQAATYGVALPVVENCAVWAVAHEDGSFRPIE